MTQVKPADDDRSMIRERAHELYRQRIRAEVEPEHVGEFLVVDVRSGEYEVDKDPAAASKPIHGRCPNADGYVFRVGYSTAFARRSPKLPRSEQEPVGCQ